MKKSRFSLCRRCGNLVGRIHESGQPLFCCGEEMEALEPNTVEASGEKHLPVVTAEPGAVRVCVGSTAHPMLPEHSIQWIYLQTANGGQRKALKPGDDPSVTFRLGEGDEPVAVYAYCNLHGLWATEL